jgi:hypothetical protein
LQNLISEYPLPSILIKIKKKIHKIFSITKQIQKQNKPKRHFLPKENFKHVLHKKKPINFLQKKKKNQRTQLSKEQNKKSNAD